MQVTIQTTVDRDEAETLLGLYRASITPLNELAAGVQAYSDDDFQAQLNNEAVLKLVGRDATSAPQALCLVATELSEVPWISPAFYKARFPDQFARRAILYVTTVVVQPDEQGAGWANALFTEVTRLCSERQGIAAFDCCGITQDLVPDLAYRVSTQFCDVEPLEIDSQRFYAYVVTATRPDAFADVDREIDLREPEAEEGEVEVDLVGFDKPDHDEARNPGSRT